MKELELTSFQLITNAGGARSKCFEAIKAAKQGKFEQATAYIGEGEAFFLKAHESHRSLIQKEASGDKIMMTMLLSHAEDQLMTAELAKEMALEFIEVHQRIKHLEETINSNE